MRILMLNNEFPPLGGGTAVINFHLLEEFAREPDIWVDLVTSSRNRRGYETERFSERITLHKVPVDNRNVHHATRPELLRYVWRGWRLSRTLMARQPYDLSFALAGVPAGAISYALKLSTGLPYVVSTQGDDVPGFADRYRHLYPFLTPLIRRIWRGASAVTAMSTRHQRLAHETAPELDIKIIGNGVDAETFRPAERPRDPAKVNILCVARLITRKGQHHLLHAFAALRAAGTEGTRLTLVGTGDGDAALRRLAADLGVAEAVTFTGAVARNEAPETYREGDVFVLPSQNEGMSVALLEAMATGLPVVVTDSGGTSELVRDGVNGFIVDWGDVPALGRALDVLVRDAPLRDRMGKASRQIAAERSWPPIAYAYRQLCVEAVRTASAAVVGVNAVPSARHDQ